MSVQIASLNYSAHIWSPASWGDLDGFQGLLGVGADGIAHFPVAGGLVDAAMPLIGRGRSAAWAGRSGRGQDAAATAKGVRTQGSSARDSAIDR
jgi:hypothetical protein